MMLPTWGCEDNEMGCEKAPNMVTHCHITGIQEILSLDLLEKETVRPKAPASINTLTTNCIQAEKQVGDNLDMRHSVGEQIKLFRKTRTLRVDAPYRTCLSA